MKTPAKLLAALAILPLAALGLTGCGNNAQTTCKKIGEMVNGSSSDEEAKKKLEELAGSAKDKELKKALQDLHSAVSVEASTPDLPEAVNVIDGKCPDLNLKKKMTG